MTPILVFDTETNGLPQWNLPSEDPSQPHITQLAAELFDEDSGKVLSYMNLLIKPDGWTIPAELEQLTGITNEMANLFGVPIELAMQVFVPMWRKCEVRVAHNESFDMRMVRIEMMRQLDLDDAFHEEWKSAPVFCTQANSTKILNLPPTEKMIRAGRKHAKSPNLAEAFQHFAGKPLEGAHDASIDLSACKTVYLGIKALRAEATA